ncbi:MAG: YciI family protein [Intrasporangium sp.]|uniref:YciI family protein n=1 Tax=Intrasporangium sp. TaxID=1925024 RepID=UPI0026470769|nr:YciI family protein [Intrasporangium sp.]MDN5798331.1 YciI family protein [Intrasporangium sp.]
MAYYLIAFNDEWVPDLTLEEIRERGTAGRAVIDEITAAGAFVFSDGGLDASTAVCSVDPSSVDPSSGSPVFTDGPFVETKEHLGGFAVVDVPDEAQARYWAGRIAVAVGWPQELHRFPHRLEPLSRPWSGPG